MARGLCQRIDYEAVFGAQIKAKLTEKRIKSENMASLMGHTLRTLQSRFKKPSDMTLGQLKVFIKKTDIEPEKVLNYLYEKGEYK